MSVNSRLSPESIQKNRLLRRLAPEQLDRLIPDLEPVTMPLKKMLQRRGDRVEFAYFRRIPSFRSWSFSKMAAWSRLEWSDGKT